MDRLKPKQGVAPWLCFSVAVVDRNQLPHMRVCASSRICIANYTHPLGRETTHDTAQHRQLRRGCLSDKARSRSNDSSSARARTFCSTQYCHSGRFDEIPCPLYIVVVGYLGKIVLVAVTNSFVCSVLISPCGISTLEPAPIRAFEDGAHILAVNPCGMRVSLLLLFLYCS